MGLELGLSPWALKNRNVLTTTFKLGEMVEHRLEANNFIPDGTLIPWFIEVLNARLV